MTNTTSSYHTDPDLPSYRNPEYVDAIDKLIFVKDMFEGRSRWISPLGRILDPEKANCYLPIEPKEPENDYLTRLLRSNFERFFGESVETFAGYLSSFVTEDLAPSIEDALDDVDFKGNNLEVFLKQADELAVRDERCYILVEHPRRPENINNLAEERSLNLRPYLVLIEAMQIVNWKTNPYGEILQVTIEQSVETDNGTFGSKTVTHYRVLRPGQWQVIAEEDGKYFLVDEGVTSLDFVPLVPYSVSPKTKDPFKGDPPLYSLAEMNLTHYRKRSDLDWIVHKANQPMLNIKELEMYRDGVAPNEEQPSVIIGPNTCLWNVDARYVEPAGTAIASSQTDLKELELRMEYRTLQFLSGSVASNRTATEMSLISSPVQANLASMARAKESSVERIFRYWQQYESASILPSRIVVDEKILQESMPSDRAQFLLSVRSAGEMSRKTFLSELRRGKILTKDFDVDAEVELLTEEEEANKPAIPRDPAEFIPSALI